MIRLYDNMLCRLWPLINSCSPHHCRFWCVHTVFLLSMHKTYQMLFESGFELISVTCVLWYGTEFAINIIEIPGIVMQIKTKVWQDVYRLGSCLSLIWYCKSVQAVPNFRTLFIPENMYESQYVWKKSDQLICCKGGYIPFA